MSFFGFIISMQSVCLIAMPRIRFSYRVAAMYLPVKMGSLLLRAIRDELARAL